MRCPICKSPHTNEHGPMGAGLGSIDSSMDYIEYECSDCGEIFRISKKGGIV